MSSEERIASVGCLVDGNTTTMTSVATQSIKRRNVGRAARRRRRKLRDIQSVVVVGYNVAVDQESAVVPAQPNLSNPPARVVKSIALGNEEGSSEAKPPPSPAVLPTDRSCISGPAVVQHRHVNQWSSHDERALQAQLGYVPGNAIRIAARVKDVATFFSPSSSVGMATSVDDGHDTNVGRLVTAATGETDTDTIPKARKDHALQQQPVVVQLYPLVWREPHAGGKAGGLRFKARKRQKHQDKSPSTNGCSASHEVSSSVDDDNVVVADADAEDPSLQNTAAKMNDSSTDATAADIAPNDDTINSNSNNWLVEPFPTIYWLTHPTLHAAIAELERDGYGVQFEQRLAADAVALDCMRRAHETYGNERWTLLSLTDQAYIQRRNWHESAFSVQRGVAGSTNPNAVKCLHAHTAHYLSGCTDNVIGQWAMEALNDKSTKSKQSVEKIDST